MREKPMISTGINIRVGKSEEISLRGIGVNTSTKRSIESMSISTSTIGTTGITTLANNISTYICAEGRLIEAIDNNTISNKNDKSKRLCIIIIADLQKNNIGNKTSLPPNK